MKILVVDDNLETRDSLARMLRISGHDVRAAETCEMAKEAWQDCDAIISDYDLGRGQNGAELLTWVRATHPQTHTAMLSGLTRDDCPSADKQILKGLGGAQELLDWLREIGGPEHSL